MSRIDNLEFLSDVIPKTVTYKQFKEKQRAKDTTGHHQPAKNAATNDSPAQDTAPQRIEGDDGDDNDDEGLANGRAANHSRPSFGQRTLFDLPRSFSRQKPVEANETTQSHEADVSINSLINGSEPVEADSRDREESSGVPMEEE